MFRSLKVLAVLLTAFCFTNGGQLLGQNSSDGMVTNQFWVDYNPTIKLSEYFDIKNAIGYRTVSPHDWDRVFIRSALKFKAPKLMLEKLKYKEELYAGIDVYYTDNLDKVDRMEITPFQAYSLTLPNRLRLNIKHYVKLEERFELETDDWENTFGLRLSYEASVIIRFQGDFWTYGKGFYIPVSAKFYWNLIGTKQFNDKLRITPGLGYTLSPQWKAAFFVGYNYSRQEVGESFHTNNIIYRLRVYHTINKN